MFGSVWRSLSASFEELSGVGKSFIVVLIFACVFCTSVAIYQCYFHPLSVFPGPKTAAISWARYSWYALSGTFPEDVEKLHQYYGRVVRIGPNSLSFSSLKAMDDIYGAAGNRPICVKSGRFYDGIAMSSTIPGMRSMLTEKDPHKHDATRRYFSPCFSTKALAEQEETLQRFTDLFIEKMRKFGNKPEGVEMGYWFHALAFDITGSLSFGESFGSLENEKLHPWVDYILSHFKLAVVVHIVNAYPSVLKGLMRLVPPEIRHATRRNREYAERQVRNRLQAVERGQNQTKKDFFSAIVDNMKAERLSDDEMVAHAASFVIAGSETTGTALASTTYWIATHPDVSQKLTSELHAAFPSVNDIKADRLVQLPYLNAVINESLRVYPPVGWGGQRISPGTVVDGYFVPKGCEVSCSFYTMSRSQENFRDPLDFIPDRWMDGADNKRASQPFSYGPRNCIGRYMALMEMRLVLSKLLHSFDLEMIRNDLDWLKESKSYIMWDKPKLHMRVIPKRADIDREVI